MSKPKKLGEEIEIKVTITASFECPDCKGKGYFYDTDEYGSHHWPTCQTCRGYGKVVSTKTQSWADYCKLKSKKAKK